MTTIKVQLKLKITMKRARRGHLVVAIFSWHDHVSQMLTSFVMCATFVAGTKNVSESLQKYFLCP